MVVLLLPLSLAMDDNFDRSGCGGGGGGPVAEAVVVVVAVDDRDQWRWHLMAATAFDGGHATTSRHSKRAAQQENKRAAQGEAMQQPANLPLCHHFDMQHCHLSCRHGITRHLCLPRGYGDTRHCLWP